MKRLPSTHIDLPLVGKEVFPNTGVHCVWLGQSGFLFSVDGMLILVDAYLSNYLESNHGTLPYRHDRMIAPPLNEVLYPEIDLVVVTHGHEDHLDPLLMERLARVNDKALFVAPPGCAGQLEACNIPADRIRRVSQGNPYSFGSTIRIEGFPAAHPIPEFDPEDVWGLSYRFEFSDTRILFAGDTTVYAQWSMWVAEHPCDVFILPVNGRDPEKEANGIVGNMSFHEALVVALSNRTPLLGTHFGMFSFNTIEEEKFRKDICDFRLQDTVELTELEWMYSFK
jgi:L-ascorbate metabolism protein UlaG (beta-lactamase superfamily)